jgi:sulfate transport system ATP-binding protein
MGIEVKGLVKRFGPAGGKGGVNVIDGVSFAVRPGELVALLGPSGSGKSTLLRLVAGLERADAGEVWLEGKRVDDLDARERGVGFVFQHYALFRHMSVGDNVGFGLDVAGVPRPERDSRVRELLGLVGLSGLEGRMPAQLSGGQRQRVALARALAPKPSLLLLDEPFGALDARVREELRSWLRHLHDSHPTTSLFVTHDQEEAFAVADRVIILRGGSVEQDGAPLEILDHPATPFVAEFVGDVNVYEVEGVGVVQGLDLNLNEPPQGRARVIVRATDVIATRHPVGNAVVRRAVPLGDRVRVEIVHDGGAVVHAQLPRRGGQLGGMDLGARVSVSVAQARAWALEG